MDSAALAAAVALPRSGGPNFPKGILKCKQKILAKFRNVIYRNGHGKTTLLASMPILTEKKMAFLDKDMTKVKELNKEFKKKVFLAKLEYKDKVERNLFVGNVKELVCG